MLIINEFGNVALTRNNSLDLVVQPEYDETGEPIIPIEDEILIFSIGHRNKIIVEKHLTLEDYDYEQEGFILHLTPEETDIEPYKYKFDFMYIFADGRTASLPVRIFEILDGVSRKPRADNDG